jgi:tetratricopeptide (TPR) repeat protein/calcineurin-like phosphoesterase family protein
MISSTVLDLPGHRQHARDACERMNMFPLVMEQMPASPSGALAASLAYVDQADFYLGIFAFRYGAVVASLDKSITEAEYDRAVERAIPIFIFIAHEQHPVSFADVDTSDGATKLQALKDRLRKAHVVRVFRSAEELRTEIIHALSDYRQEDARTLVAQPPERPDVFVIMPFGKREHPSTSPEPLDFDTVYKDIIRAAAEDVNWNATRIDDTPFTGEVSHHFIERLLHADLVLADVSVPNGNVYYELGVRHGIAAGGTILIALEGSELPFDIRNQRTIFYTLTQDGLRKARSEIADALRFYEPVGSPNPVRRHLVTLGESSNPVHDAAAFDAEFNGRIERAATAEQMRAVWSWAKHLRPQPMSGLLRLARRFGELGDWSAAVETLRSAVSQYVNDYEAHRQLAFSLRKLDPDAYDEAEVEFKKALFLNPDDPEALGMLGGLYKRQGRYADAQACYDRAATLAPSSEYALINQAAMAILGTPNAPDRGIALYRSLLKKVTEREHYSDLWGLLVAGEAAFAVGDDEAAADFYRRAMQLSANPVPFESAADQLDLLARAQFRPQRALTHSTRLREAVKGLRVPISLSERADQDSGVASHLPVLVHLSDIHFGTRQTASGQLQMHRFIEGEWGEPLARHLEREFGHLKAFDYDPTRLHLVISGDLTYTASAEEFRMADAFLVEVAQILGIERERVHLVPGNHDVNWKSADADLSRRFDHYVAFLDSFYGSVLLRSRFPYLKWDLRAHTLRDSPAQLLSLYASEQIVVVGLNSCAYEAEQDHFGFVGGRQLRLMEDWFNKHNVTAFDETVRVAVVHHHLHPLPEEVMEARDLEDVWQDLSTIRDTGLVERALERRGFDLVLHGHKHHAQLRETLIRQQFEPHRTLSRLIVCGCGSTGVARSELEQGGGNHYQVIELLRVPRKSTAAFVKIHWRELAYRADAEWRTTEAWTVDG